MRILHVRFKNINSLAGEWSIDFTNPDYLSNGIFAIAGPTGSGKTTILDAICLAIYGKTPRLERINKNTNEIMTSQTGECFADGPSDRRTIDRYTSPRSADSNSFVNASICQGKVPKRSRTSALVLARRIRQ